jgi:murein DD-endopeptidase MepM/ murein hydrolase activator NlpD
MKSESFHPVIQLPPDYEIYDFSKDYDPNRTLRSPFGVGKFLERRPTMYVQEQYTKTQRNIHLGIDIGAPIGTPIMAFADGTIFSYANNDLPGDYGYTIITKHTALDQTLYCLFGHLAKQSLDGLTPGKPLKKGEVFAWVGDKTENGGWNPHLHFQVSNKIPEKCDMPGVVSEQDLENALKIYLDPRLILGNLY